MNRVILAIFLITMLFACSKPSTQQVKAEEDETVFRVGFKEQPAVNKTLKLSISTKAIYPCVNFGIETKMIKNGNNILIELGKVVESVVCLTAIGPANAEIDLGTLPTGTYNLKFAANGKILTGSLIVTNEKYTLSFARQNTLIFVNPRIKQNS